jgi:hypothetical protein
MKRPETDLEYQQEIAALMDKFGKSIVRLHFFGGDKASNAKLETLVPQLKRDLITSFERIVFPEDRLDFVNRFVDQHLSENQLHRLRHNYQFLSPEGVARSILVKALHLRLAEFGPAAQEEEKTLPPSWEANEDAEEEFLPELR